MVVTGPWTRFRPFFSRVVPSAQCSKAVKPLGPAKPTGDNDLRSQCVFKEDI